MTTNGNPDAILEAVLFDLDGTLVDSTELILACYRHTTRTHLGWVPPDDAWLEGFGTPLEQQIARFARSPDEAQAMIATYRAYQREHHDRTVRPFPGVPETLRALADRGLKLAVVTSKHKALAVRGLELCGLAPWLPLCIAPEDVTRPKPHPEPVERALACLGVAPERALFVGDSPHDVAAGRAAGVRTAVALWGPFPRSAFATHPPDLWLAQPQDLLALLEGAAVSS
ncbi:MAG TPA: HAD-IA family hydrolase [Chloroflexota bacterium]